MDAACPWLSRAVLALSLAGAALYAVSLRAPAPPRADPVLRARLELRGSQLVALQAHVLLMEQRMEEAEMILDPTRITDEELRAAVGKDPCNPPIGSCFD